MSNSPYNPQPQTPMGNPPSSNNKVILIVLGVLGVLMLVGILVCAGVGFFVMQAAGQAQNKAENNNRLKRIGLAVHNYESAYRSLPSPYAFNEKDEPTWSWRVSILPFLEEADLFNTVLTVNFENGMKPWDHSQNVALQGDCPEVLRTIDSTAPLDHSHVFAISSSEPGPNSAAMVDGQYYRFRDILDGTSNTLMALQFTRHSANWADPRPISVEEAYQYLQDEPEGCNALFYDGAVRFLSKDTSRELFEAIVTSRGGEIIDTSFGEEGP